MSRWGCGLRAGVIFIIFFLYRFARHPVTEWRVLNIDVKCHHPCPRFLRQGSSQPEWIEAKKLYSTPHLASVFAFGKNITPILVLSAAAILSPAYCRLHPARDPCGSSASGLMDGAVHYPGLPCSFAYIYAAWSRPTEMLYREGRDLILGAWRSTCAPTPQNQAPTGSRAIALYLSIVAFCYLSCRCTAFYTLAQLIRATDASPMRPLPLVEMS